MLDITRAHIPVAKPQPPRVESLIFLVQSVDLYEFKQSDGTVVQIPRGFNYELNVTEAQARAIRDILAGNLPDGTKCDPARQGVGSPVVVGRMRVPWSRRELTNQGDYARMIARARDAGLKIPERQQNAFEGPQLNEAPAEEAVDTPPINL